MTTRILPPSDLFATCPLDGKILEFYAGAFEAVYVSLNPFLLPTALDRDDFKPDTYPNRAKIVANCKPVSWAEVARLAGLPSLAAVDIALRTGIGGLKEELRNVAYASAIANLMETHNILPPSEGCFSDVLHGRVLQGCRRLVTSGSGWVMSSVPKESCIGSTIFKIKSKASRKGASMCLPRTSDCYERSIGIATSRFSVLLEKIFLRSSRLPDLKDSSVQTRQKFIGVCAHNRSLADRSLKVVLARYARTMEEDMRPSKALEQTREAIREIVPQFRTANPRVFGSVLHGLDRETSDLDILVDTLPGTTLFDLGALQERLRALLGVRVDVRTPGDLPQAFREEVISEAKPV